MNNAFAGAWDDSNETNKASFERITLTGTYSELNVQGASSDYKELHFHLVGDSHVVLRNIQLRENRTGANLILNGDTLSANGSGASGWLAQGTHFLSFLQDGELHLRADGHGDNRPNRVEIDVPGLIARRTYELSFDARWIAGSSRLIAQTWDHSFGDTFSLTVPKNLGTPGARNSTYIPLPTAQVESVKHSPPVPAPG